MSSESENFDALRRLLALKRHEQPPPGYFDQFSTRVVARLRTEKEAQAEVADRMVWELPWVAAILRAFSVAPAVSGAVGIAACCLLVTGLVYSNNHINSAVVGYTPNTAAETASDTDLANQSSGFVSSTNGFDPDAAHGSLFEELRNNQAQPKLVNTTVTH